MILKHWIGIFQCQIHSSQKDQAGLRGVQSCLEKELGENSGNTGCGPDQTRTSEKYKIVTKLVDPAIAPEIHGASIVATSLPPIPPALRCGSSAWRELSQSRPLDGPGLAQPFRVISALLPQWLIQVLIRVIPGTFVQWLEKERLPVLHLFSRAWYMGMGPETAACTSLQWGTQSEDKASS